MCIGAAEPSPFQYASWACLCAGMSTPLVADCQDLARSDGDNSEAINYRQLYGPSELPSVPPPRFDFGPRWL